MYKILYCIQEFNRSWDQIEAKSEMTGATQMDVLVTLDKYGIYMHRTRMLLAIRNLQSVYVGTVAILAEGQVP